MNQQLILTRYRVVQPEHRELVESAICETMWPKVPGNRPLRELLMPLLGGIMEHVTVLNDFEGGDQFVRSDMFVHDEGHSLKLPRNEIATTIYRRATLMGRSAAKRPPDPEDMAHIVGPAVLFDRQVWF